MPVIKISSIKDVTRTSAKGKKYKVVEVKGTKYGSEDEWKTDIFKNKTDIIEQLDEFGPGELVNISFVKNGNFYDINSITTPTEENLAYAKKNNAGHIGGTSNGNRNNSSNFWNGRTGAAYDRSAAVYLAFDILKTNRTEAALRKMKDDELLAKVFEIAEVINDYIHEGENQFLPPDLETNEASDGDDPLNPPV